MKRTPLIWALAVVFGALAMGAELPDAWKNWQYSRPLTTTPPTDKQFIKVALPPEVFGRARENLADLRLIDDQGNEVPYILHARHGRGTQDWRGTVLSDVGFVPGQYTQLVADAGTGGKKHNSLELEIDETDFFTWVEVAASDDRQTWRIVRERAPIYRFKEDGLEGTRTISYPDTRSRWLRLRILFGDRQLPVRQCRVTEEVREEAELETLAAELRLAPHSSAEESHREVDLGSGKVPASTVQFETDREEFHRPVRLSASEDGENWREVGQREIYRYRVRGEEETAGEGQREQLKVHFPEARGRYWRVTVFNRNDPPIEDLRVSLLGTPRYVVFRPEPGRSYRLIYGNSRIDSPQYELARLTAREEAEEATLARLGVEDLNEGYVSPEPWTERHPAVLWVALGLAIVVLAWLALRSLR